MKKDLSDIISLIIIIFNAISVICLMLPPGRMYYLPALVAEFTLFLSAYSIFGLGVSGALGIILNITAIMLKKTKRLTFGRNIVYIVIFALTIPLSMLTFDFAMSV